jgi:hypothetical protein
LHPSRPPVLESSRALSSHCGDGLEEAQIEGPEINSDHHVGSPFAGGFQQQSERALEPPQLAKGIGGTDDRMRGQVAENFHAGRRHGRPPRSEKLGFQRPRPTAQSTNQLGGELVATGLTGD